MTRVKYSCHGCGLTAIEVEVPARGDEDIITWLEQTRPYLVAAHHRQSPECNSPVCDLMIPFNNGAQRIGGLPVH